MGEYKMHQFLELGNLDLPYSASQKKPKNKQKKPQPKTKHRPNPKTPLSFTS